MTRAESMPTQAEIVPASDEHIEHIIAHMRDPDRAEVAAMTGLEPGRAIRVGLNTTESPKVGLADGEPVCLFGVASGTLIGLGRPWLIGTPVIERFHFAFLRRNREWVRGELAHWQTLENWADARNVVALRWLRWLNFEIHDAEPFGPYRLPFHRFTMKAPT